MIVLTAFAGLLAATAAQASPSPALVIGSSAAQDCYEAARRTGAFNTNIQSCLAALEDLGLSVDDRAATYVNLGILMRRRGNMAGAINAYDRAIALRPGLAEAWLNRGAAHVSMGESRQAIQDLNTALSLDPERAEFALVNRAAAYEDIGELEAAYADLQAALALAPEFDPALTMISRYQVRTGQTGGLR